MNYEILYVAGQQQQQQQLTVGVQPVAVLRRKLGFALGVHVDTVMQMLTHWSNLKLTVIPLCGVKRHSAKDG